MKRNEWLRLVWWVELPPFFDGLHPPGLLFGDFDQFFRTTFSHEITSFPIQLFYRSSDRIILTLTLPAGKDMWSRQHPALIAENLGHTYAADGE